MTVTVLGLISFLGKPPLRVDIPGAGGSLVTQADAKVAYIQWEMGHWAVSGGNFSKAMNLIISCDCGVCILVKMSEEKPKSPDIYK